MYPFIYLNVAISADGKLAPANRRFEPFGSRHDRELLLELRSRADAVMSGARTVDLMPVNLGPGPAKYRRRRLKRGLAEYNLRVVVSGSGSLDPRAEIFRQRFSPIIVLASGRASESKLRRLRGLADAVGVFGENDLDFPAALAWLRQRWEVKTLLCEGGGEVNAGLFRAGLVQEVYVTICPLVFGGRGAPTLSDGAGAPTLAEATQLELKKAKRIGGEIFLTYRVRAESPGRTH